MDDWTNKIIARIKKSSELCRECNHIRIGHAEHVGCLEVYGKEDNLIRCKCKEFVPPDNLDYVEYLAKKRGLLGK